MRRGDGNRRYRVTAVGSSGVMRSNEKLSNETLSPRRRSLGRSRTRGGGSGRHIDCGTQFHRRACGLAGASEVPLRAGFCPASFDGHDRGADARNRRRRRGRRRACADAHRGRAPCAGGFPRRPARGRSRGLRRPARAPRHGEHQSRSSSRATHSCWRGSSASAIAGWFTRSPGRRGGAAMPPPA